MKPTNLDRLMESPGFPASLKAAILAKRKQEGREGQAQNASVRDGATPSPEGDKGVLSVSTGQYAPVVTDPIEAVRVAYAGTRDAIRALRAMASAGDEVAKERIVELEADLAKLEAEGKRLKEERDAASAPSVG